jgi:hypothetical protein
MENYVIGPLTGVVLSGWMGNSVYQRLELALYKKGLTVREFEKRERIGRLGRLSFLGRVFGRRRRFVRAMRSGDGEVAKWWVMRVIGAYPEFSYDWLLHGEGEPLREPFRD